MRVAIVHDRLTQNAHERASRPLATASSPSAGRWSPRAETLRGPVRSVIVASWGERLGGAENRLLTFCEEIDRLAIDPHFVFLQPGPLPGEVADLGIRTTVIPAGRLRQLNRFPRVVRDLVGILRRDHPEAVLSWTTKAHLYCGPAAAAARLSRRTLFWPAEIPDGGWLSRLATAIPSAGAICSSHAVAEAQARLRPRRPVTVVHPGVRAALPLSDAERRALRAGLGIPHDAVLVGTVGRLQRWKGHHHVLEALASIDAPEPVHGLVVGGDAHGLEPDCEPELHRRAEALGVADRVKFTGQVPDARRLMGAMDVLVNASDNEPFGIVLIEAMALGIPIVAFASAGPTEIVADGRSGILVPPGDVRSLTTAVERLVRDRALRSQMGRAGHDLYQARFTASRMAEQITGALAAVAGRSVPGDAAA